jgi:hypothetical protein
MKRFQILSLIAVLAVLTMSSCKRSKVSEPSMPPTQSHFTNQSGGNFYIQNVSNPTFKIPIGITAPVASDTRVTVSISSPTGAAAGVQYTLPSTTITIPAGKTLDSLAVQGIFAGFPGSRVDTLVVKITGGDVEAAAYNDTYKLVLQKYCPVTLSSFAGTWSNMNDNDGTPVYSATVAPITAANQTSATTGYIMITGLWGVAGSGPIRVDLDWTDPANFKTNIPTGQNLYVDPAFGQAKVRPTGNGTFSSCNGTLTLKYQVYVAAGSFTATSTTMAR